MGKIDAVQINGKCMICQDPEGDVICVDCLRDEKRRAAFQRIAFLEVNGKLSSYEREEIIKEIAFSTPRQA